MLHVPITFQRLSSLVWCYNLYFKSLSKLCFFKTNGWKALMSSMLPQVAKFVAICYSNMHLTFLLATVHISISVFLVVRSACLAIFFHLCFCAQYRSKIIGKEPYHVASIYWRLYGRQKFKTNSFLAYFFSYSFILFMHLIHISINIYYFPFSLYFECVCLHFFK